jgi:hypothetical protein
VEYLSFPAVNQCGIKKKDLVNEDPFEVVFKKMMKWIYNRVLGTSRMSKKNGKQQKTFYPGKFEVFQPYKGLFALGIFVRKRC